MSSPLIEAVHPGDFILTESRRTISRDNVTLLAGSVYQPGQVLGLITASGKYAAHNPAAADGSQNAVAVCIYRYDATAADVKGVIIARDAEVKADGLIWAVGISAPNKAAGIASLKAQQIMVR